jgi:hypothetical protein
MASPRQDYQSRPLLRQHFSWRRASPTIAILATWVYVMVCMRVNLEWILTLDRVGRQSNLPQRSVDNLSIPGENEAQRNGPLREVRRVDTNKHLPHRDVDPVSTRPDSNEAKRKEPLFESRRIDTKEQSVATPTQNVNSPHAADAVTRIPLKFRLPPQMLDEADDGSQDYGSLELPLLNVDAVLVSDEEALEEYRAELLGAWDHNDDQADVEYDDEFQTYNTDDESNCRNPNWSRHHDIKNCNTIHELPLLLSLDTKQHQLLPTYRIEPLSFGAFRNSWRFVDTTTGALSATAGDRWVMKVLHLRWGASAVQMEGIGNEAAAMGRIMSPRIVKSYGFCGGTMLVEDMVHEITTDIVPGAKFGRRRGLVKDKDFLQEGDVVPVNNYTSLEKLQIATRMAEAIADVHGFAGGVIVHFDIHPDQWLVDRQGEIKCKDEI